MKKILFSLVFILFSFITRGEVRDNRFNDTNDPRQKEFDSTLEWVKKKYTSIIAPSGLKLTFYPTFILNLPLGKIDIFNGSLALSISGGFLTLPGGSIDVLALAICHELGHFLGGPPRFRRNGKIWSAESQADYYASNYCVKQFFKEYTNSTIKEQTNYPSNERTSSTGAGIITAEDPIISSSCNEQFTTLEDVGFCVRAINASVNFIKIIMDHKNKKNIVDVSTPSKATTTSTILLYPSDQCRLDNMFAAALDLKRPSCWFKE